MKIAIVRIRGDTRKKGDIGYTFKLLNLNKKNHCVIVEETPHIKGMLRLIEPFATWGPVDEKTATALKKKGKETFCLNPPKRGFGRKGVKMPFKKGGAYGNRAEKINDLLTRMM
ncbi:50S ribosomal protein L30 [uncultured archaeon]|nr:50S ribosomal protein L30 [uncultured archaeon]